MKLYRLTVALLVFVACSCVCACVLGLVFHSLSFHIAAASFGLGMASAFLAVRAIKQQPASHPFTWADWLMILVFAIVSLRAFLWLACYDGDDFKVLSPNNLGDLSLHWNYIRFMAKGCDFWPDNTLLAGYTIRYPIGMDLLNSLLVLCGADILKSLVWVGLVGSLLTGVAMFRWGRAFTLAGFLFNGGLAGFVILKTFVFKDYQSDLAWKNLFLSIMVTQRGFLFCLPAGLILLDSWRERWEGREPSLPIWIEIVLYSAMPLFHFHTFMFLSMMLGCWLVHSRKAIRAHVLKLGFISLVPASFLSLFVTEFFGGPSFFRVQPGWMQHDAPLLQFWIGNFGIFIPLCLGLCALLAIKRDDAIAIAFVLPACLVFLLCCLFLFAPWEWDNTKLILWFYLTVLPFIWHRVIKVFPVAVRACLCVALFFSGFVSLIGGLNKTGFGIASRAELDAIELVLNSIPISTRFAAAPDYSHPLLFMGRKVAMAYTGFLFGHGLPYEKQEQTLTVLMMGDLGWQEAAKQLHASYIFWGAREEKAYPNSAKSWAESSLVVASGSWGKLYKLSL